MNEKQADHTRHLDSPENWVELYGDYLYEYAFRRVRDPSIAEDLVQEAFLSAIQAHSSFEGRSSIKTWLTGILKHKIIDHFRKRFREEAFEDTKFSGRSLDEFFDKKEQWQVKPVKWSDSPQKLFEQKEFMKVLHNCLAELSNQLASAFILREMVGESTEEICKILNISATNCWVMLYRARMYLRRCLEINWFESKTFEGS